jgi:hypothetical protein
VISSKPVSGPRVDLLLLKVVALTITNGMSTAHLADDAPGVVESPTHSSRLPAGTEYR